MVHLTITALELSDHGPFRGPHRFELAAEGPAVYIRPNEFGKTTLLESVAAILWGETMTSKNWLSSPQEPHRGAVEFVRRQSGQACRFRVERDFQTHEVVAWQLDAEGGRRELFRGTHNPAGRTPDQRRWPDKKLPELWAPLSCEAFRHLGMLTQPLPEEFEGGLVQRLVGGSGSSTANSAQETLVERFRTLSKSSKEAGISERNARRDGELDKLRARRDELQAQLSQAAGDLDHVENLRGQLEQLDHQARALHQGRKRAEDSLEVIERYRGLNREFDNAAQRAGQFENAMRQVEKARQEIATADGQIARLPEEIRKLDREELPGLKERLDHYRLRRAGLKDPEELAARLEALQEEYAEVWDWPDDASQRVRPLQESTEQGAAARRKVEQLQHRLESVQPRSDVVRRRVAAAAVGLPAAALAATVIGLAANSWPWGVVAGLLAGIAAAATAYSFYQPQKVHPDHPQVAEELAEAIRRLDQLERTIESARANVDWTRQTNVTRLVQLAERRNTLRRQLDELHEEENRQSRLRAELDPAGLPQPLPRLLHSCQGNPEDAANRLEELQAALNRRTAAGEKVTAMLGTVQCRDASELEAQRQTWQDRRVGIRRDLDLLVKENALAEALQEMPAADVEARRDQLQQQVEKDKRELETLEGRRLGVRGDLAAAEAGVKINVAEGEVQLRQFEAEIERLAGRCEAIRQAHRLLGEAAVRYSAHHREAIEDRINDLMGAWTGWTDRRFTVAADFSLGLTIEKADGQEEQVELSVLSQGACDQLALAARMAVLDRVGAEVVLPILIDDAFLTWDEERRGRLSAAWQSAAASRQIILVSHDAAFESWGEQINCTSGSTAVTPGGSGQ